MISWILDILLSFFINLFWGGGGRKTQVCPRAPDNLAAPLFAMDIYLNGRLEIQ